MASSKELKGGGSVLFIDDESKRLFYSHELINEKSHLSDAYWVPAIGYNAWDGHIYIAGATGAGKSYIIRKIINNDKKKRACILFTDLTMDDPAFAGMNYEKYQLKDEKGKSVDPFESLWLKEREANRILIFDDVQYNKSQIRYRDFMLEKGRHLGTIVICVNHKLQDYWQTKVPLNDSRFVVTFPSANKGAVKRYIKSELELHPVIIDEIIAVADEEGRQLIIHKHAPNCIACGETIFKV